MVAVRLSSLSQYIKKIIRDDHILSNVNVRGELSSLTISGRGHCFFTIKDQNSVLNGIVFNWKSNTEIENAIGMEVDVSGAITIYDERSQYQINAKKIELVKEGNLFAELEKLRKKLQKEGLFDDSKKRPLPIYPHTIGLITSATGAAVNDLINVLKRRSPMSKLILYPAIVQGNAAAKSMIEALDYFNNRNDLSLIIIGRGGGSFEDLFCFNDENLVRAVANSKYPIISAVGHESDNVLTDFAADLRASTPTSAGELATRHIDEMIEEIDRYEDKLYNTLKNLFKDDKRYLDSLKESLLIRSPMAKIDKSNLVLKSILERMPNKEEVFLDRRKNLLNLKEALIFNIKQNKSDKKHELELVKSNLEASNPLNILKKGYGVISFNNKIIKNSKSLKVNEKVNIQLFEGSADAIIKNIYEDD